MDTVKLISTHYALVCLFVMTLQHGQVVVTIELVELVLGPPVFSRNDNAERVAEPGTAAGLVWTAVGGGVQYIECAKISSGHPDR